MLSTTQIADFAYLQQSHTLVLSVGTYSFLSSFLSSATQIHVPFMGKQEKTVVFTEPERWIYHNMVTKESFGKFDPTTDTIVYRAKLDE